MLTLRPGIEIYLSIGAVDMRKSIDTLSALIIDEFSGDPRSSHLFVCLSRSSDKVKILYWDRNGFVLHYKRLEKHRFIVRKIPGQQHLFRQEQMLRRIGIDIPRSTLCLWIIRMHELFKPMMEMLKKSIQHYDVAYSDETTLQVLKEPNKLVHSTKYMWLFAGGPPEKFCYIYHYHHHSRTHDVLLHFFEHYKGTIHCDGFPGYDALTDKSKQIRLSGCIYHVRRKFVEITKMTSSKEGVAHTVVNFIAQLAKIESDCHENSSEDKKIVRQEKAKLILETLHEFLLTTYPKTFPKSLLGKAIFYALNQWPKLLTYLNDGRLENNNNRSERAIKPFVIGRKG